MPATFLLRTHSVTVSMSGPLTTILDHLERSVSWHERTMLMEVLISMFSAISDENFDHDEPTSLMLTASTRTLNGLSGILKRVHITRAKTEILLQEDSMSLDSPLVLFQQLKTRGLLLSARRVNENFLSLLRTSVLGISSPSLGVCTPTQNGSGPSWGNHMRVPPGSPLQMELFLSWLDGELKLWNTQVSARLRRSSDS
ncbi:putative ORF3 protein [Gemycircularvirus giapa2]|uniref:Putative ORF3 protein n=1 Tax=Giant panda associated gemycircularvirus TaxID=2016461 RepID=A0A220IGP8_9VIRU|nr:putative ORF3 protein [Giant panda associated gemycircularvirus]ASH99159.1 putative ORF3 protein [Giant panda associated gemycircularvirus]